MLSGIFTFLVGFVVLWLFNKWQNVTKKLPRGLLRIPGIGNIPQILFADSKFFYVALKKLGEKYGDILYLEVGVSKMVVITGYDAYKKICTDDRFNSRPQTKVILDRTFGKCLGIGFNNGEFWQKTRNTSMKILRDFGFGKHSMESSIKEEFEDFSKMVENATKITNGLIPLPGLFSGAFTNTIWSMIAGYRFDYDNPKFLKLVESSRVWLDTALGGAALLSAYPFMADWCPELSGFTKLQKVDKQFRNYFVELLQEVRAKGNYLEHPETFIEVFLQKIDKCQNDSGINIFTDENLISIIMDLFIGGVDTTAALTSFSLLYMIRYPEIQDKLQREIDNVVGKDRFPSIEDKDKMVYMKAVTMELTRICNIVTINPRAASQDVQFDNFIIPKGMDVLLNLYSVHMDENYWKDPHLFRPGRFLGPDGEIINSDHLIPFSLGKKYCFGESAARLNFFLFFTSLLQKYTFTGDPATKGVVNTDPVPGVAQCPHPCNIVMKPRV